MWVTQVSEAEVKSLRSPVSTARGRAIPNACRSVAPVGLPSCLWWSWIVMETSKARRPAAALNGDNERCPSPLMSHSLWTTRSDSPVSQLPLPARPILVKHESVPEELHRCWGTAIQLVHWRQRHHWCSTIARLVPLLLQCWYTAVVLYAVLTKHNLTQVHLFLAICLLTTKVGRVVQCTRSIKVLA